MYDTSDFSKFIMLIVTAITTVALMAATTATAADPAVTCGTAKHKAATKKLSDKMKCHDKALKKDTAVDATCLTKAEDKFNTSFAKAEDKGGCATTGDAAAIETIVDDTLAALLTALPTVAPPAACDILQQDCPSEEGCYLSANTCSDGIGVCADAGTVAHGGICTTDRDCAPGLSCFTVGQTQQCLTLCEIATPACPQGTSCTSIPGCDAIDACL